MDKHSSNDPLDPIYPHDPGNPQDVKGIGSLTRNTNVLLLIVVAVVVMAALYFLGRTDTPRVETVPPATEVR
ncbi:MAG: hypothetical protein WAR83_01050 [Flavobacteriales bacterium]